VSEHIVLAHAGEEALPILIPIVLVIVFMIIKSRRHFDGDRDDRGENKDE
jgi:hypothetical protein